MKKITIFVACHKPTEVKSDDVYTPIHVGRAVSKYKEEMKDMIGDDTGDNISEKDASYSEMTGHYWVWKNYHDSEYIGFCQYRRYFYEEITPENIDGYFSKGTDVLFIGPCMRKHSRWSFLQAFVCAEDLAIMLKVVRKLYPDYYSTLSQYGFGYIDYPCNMLICRRGLFDKYAEWMFSILFECEKYIKPSPYSRARRVYGYLAEFLTPVFFIHNGYKIKPLHFYRIENYIKAGGLDFFQKTKEYILHNLLFFREKRDSIKIDPAVVTGLKNDGIFI